MPVLYHIAALSWYNAVSLHNKSITIAEVFARPSQQNSLLPIHQILLWAGIVQLAVIQFFLGSKSVGTKPVTLSQFAPLYCFPACDVI